MMGVAMFLGYLLLTLGSLVLLLNWVVRWGEHQEQKYKDSKSYEIYGAMRNSSLSNKIYQYRYLSRKRDKY
jgi:hypothetical protein